MTSGASPSPPAARPREPWIFVLACVVCGLAFQGTRGLWDPDEGRYAEATREMLAAGQWATPLLEGRPHLTKPPGAYWATGLGLSLFGLGEWGARFFLGLAFGFSAWCVRRTGRVIVGESAGARAGWCYLAMLVPFAAGSVLSTDTFLAAALAATYAAMATALVAPNPAPWLLAAGAALGAAIFTKGHVPLLSWGAFVAGWAVAGRKAFPGRRVVSTAGLVLAVVPISAWLAWLHTHVEGGLGRVLAEAEKHVADGDHGGKAWWFYPALLVAGSTPWWIRIVSGARRLGLGHAGRWIAVWAGVTFAGYLLGPTKMALYLLPLAVPLALWAGAHVPRSGDSPLPWPRWALAAWFVLLCGLRGGLGFVEDRRDMRAVARAVVAADPSGALPVGTLAGSDLQGLEFYLGDRVRRLWSREVRNSRAVAVLDDEAASRDASRSEWLLVTDDDKPERRAVKRVLGDRAFEIETVNGWRLLRVRPKDP